MPKMTVPLLDLRRQYRTFKADVLPVLERVCESQMFILGPEVSRLELATAAYCHSDHGIGVSSGTDALLLALMALDIGSGDAVITSPYTFFATGGTIARTGARPVYLDIDPVSFNLCPTRLARYLADGCETREDGLYDRASGTRVRAIMPVHLYGQMADMDPIMALAADYGLAVIEDAAQAIGAEYHGRRAGSIGDIGCFSFFPTKNLGAFGDAGLVTARDAELAERLRVMRVHGGKPKYYHAMIGGNFRIDELQAAILNVKLPLLESWTQGRQANAERYARLFAAAGLTSTVELPMALDGRRHIYNQYIVRVPERDRLKAFLAEEGIGTEIYYPVPLHQQGCFAYLGHQDGDCPESERAAAETLALPIFAELDAAELEYVVETIRRFYA
jgi:dTDP-4-amino-4,6-dideoxygalactose transaminase